MGSVSIGHASTTDREDSVSFGNENITRQLTKVKAGTMDTDAVNVKQLKDHTALEITNNNKVINQRMKEVVQLGQKAANNAERNANDYTDNQINKNNMEINQNIETSKNEAMQAGQKAANNAEKNANNYTDSKITKNNMVINQNIETSKNEAIQAGQKAANNAEKNANNYTDSKINKNNMVINQNIDNTKKEIIQLGEKSINNVKKESIAYTDAKFNQIDNRINSSFQQLNDKIDENAKKANAGIASVAAMTNIPYVNYQKFSVGAGLGNYRNGNAIAVGMQYKLNENTHVRASTSWNSSDSAVFGGGIAIGW
ncbi:YadA C-terminal domain-containing protein [Proteus penneri]|nr:YadA-like family protein [Proteus penneri]